MAENVSLQIKKTLDKFNTDIEITDASVREYINCVHDLLDNKEVLSLKDYVQHGGITRLNHSLNVSYIGYRVSKRLKLDYVSTARGGLLHDFFLYNWRDRDSGKPYKGMHGMAHPKVALKNANIYFNLNQCEQDIIRKHMWPLTVSLPQYSESYVILAVDKYCAVAEFLKMLNIKKMAMITTIVTNTYILV